MAFWNRFRRDDAEVTEATKALTPAQVPERAGFAYGVPTGGLNEYNSAIGGATGSDRRSQLSQLFDAYLTCPWAWACVQAVARTITAGGLVMDWDSDTGEGDQEAPDKPEAVLAVERLFDFTNERQNIRQLLRNVVVDLLVFGDAFIEVTWWAELPVALYNLDNPSMTPLTDEHGKVSGYVQVTDQNQRADFEPRDVIHISLDAPRSAVFGVSPTQAALLPITAWLFAAATGKEMARKGLPITIHVDFPASLSKSDQNLWLTQYAVRNIGPRNIGAPIATKGGGTVNELAAGKITDVITFLNQKRDEVVSCYGVPPAKVGIIESGNLGGGTGEEQDITYKVDTCGPIAELVLEAINFAVIQRAFGIDDWHAKFRDVDYRSSTAIEGIRDTRLKNGSWVLNKYRAEIGEPPVDGGDEAIILDRQGPVLWALMKSTAEAALAAAATAQSAPGEPPVDGEQPPEDEPEPEEDGAEKPVPKEAMARYRARLNEALRSMPFTESAAGAGDGVYAQLAKDFPPSAIAWVKDVPWSGPKMIPLSQVDTSDRSQWDASAQPGEVKRLRKKLRRKLAAGEKPRPVVLVKTPGGDKYLIADGHHHFLAAEAEGQRSVWAYTGKVDAEHGPWNTMATAEKGREQAA